MKLKYFTSLICMISILKTTAQSGYSLELNIKTVPTESITKNETGVGFSFYDNWNTKNEISNTISYKNTGLNFDLDNYYSSDIDYRLNRIENNLELSHKFNKKISLDLELKTVAAFENNLGISDVSLFGGAEMRYSFNEKNSLELGVKRMSVFGKAAVLPTLAFYSQLNPDTDIEIGFPNSAIHYSNNERNHFSLTNSFDGEYYKLDQNKKIESNLTASKISFSQMTTAFEYERNVDKNWFLSFQGGYQFNKKYRLTDNRGTTKFNFDANDGTLFNIGIKYKQ
ncbi:hypothetical protein B6A10_03720 [Flavobacterium sp. L1I52]|uniref:DUF6268 domain-containing protein n=2 Tax=Flavobacterium pokkalii TaxID=1940408 RepID=A0ABR7UPW8_9FLAO|nr:hypothetical protein [Flavobacterium pokkalii]